MKTTKNTNKTVSTLKKILPKDFKVTASKTGLTVYISHKCKKNESLEDVDSVVMKATKKLHLDENGSGYGFGARDWDFTDLDVEKQIVSDADKLLNSMKAFFKKWSDTYRESYKSYELIGKMRAMLETNEA